MRERIQKHCKLVISYLSADTSPEWSILTVIQCVPCRPYECNGCWRNLKGIGQVDENHIGLVETKEGLYYHSNYSVHVVNVETGKHVMVDTLNHATCYYGFVFNDLLALFTVASLFCVGCQGALLDLFCLPTKILGIIARSNFVLAFGFLPRVI